MWYLNSLFLGNLFSILKNDSSFSLFFCLTWENKKRLNLVSLWVWLLMRRDLSQHPIVKYSAYFLTLCTHSALKKVVWAQRWVTFVSECICWPVSCPEVIIHRNLLVVAAIVLLFCIAILPINVLHSWLGSSRVKFGMR